MDWAVAPGNDGTVRDFFEYAGDGGEHAGDALAGKKSKKLRGRKKSKN